MVVFSAQASRDTVNDGYLMREDCESIDRAIHEAVTIVPYDEAWPAAFLAERERLLALLPFALLAVEHFGSTAVPGMVAKPIIDILAAVQSMEAADALFAPLLRNGYTTSHAFNAMLADRRWLMRVANGRRTHHLHIVQLGGRQWQERLLFRDILREDDSLARQYGALKHRLAAEHRGNREAYTDAKAAFVASVIAAA